MYGAERKRMLTVRRSIPNYEADMEATVWCDVYCYIPVGLRYRYVHGGGVKKAEECGDRNRRVA